MKKINYAFLGLLFFTGTVYANPVTLQTAKSVASNFYSQHFKSTAIDLTLTYTEFANDSQPVYYVFNANNNGGFVIVAAEDAAHPILAYSDKGQYISNSNTAWWMNCRKQEIVVARTNNISATSGISNEWTGYINNIITKTHSDMSGVSPLTKSIWNQSPNFNAMCPGGSVTGCVATAMAQVMKYWSYPPHGHGYSGYWEKQVDGFANSYGYLEADYDSSKYVWSAMPDTIYSQNNNVAELMYDCGVSVDMDYSPSGSGAWVIDGDYPTCSQNSYVKYFGYNPKTIQGIYKSNYTYANWITTIENELNASRVIQYVGNDSVNNAGHTWVCDGYDASNNFHMNWGWGGGSNGYFAPNAINVAGYAFNWWDEAVIGIEPLKVSAYFSGSSTFISPTHSVTFKDSSIYTTAITAYKWIFPGGTPATSTVASPTVVYNNPGTYDVTEIVSVSGGVDTVVRKNYISVATSTILPLAQTFQSPVFPPTGWVLYNPHGYSYTWQLNTGVGGYGNSNQCMEFNNTQVVADFYTIYTGKWVIPPGKPGVDIIGERQQIYSPMYNFTFVPNAEISFDIAYAPFDTLAFSDTLNIYYSIDSGKTFHSVYSKGGLTLATCGGKMVSTGADTNSKGIFVPLNTNWRTDTIHIPAISGKASVMFSFENVSGNGAAMYIDNIKIPGGTTDIPTVVSTPSVKVYPNPNNGQFTIALSNATNNPLVKIYNVLGEEVYTSTLRNETNAINLSSQPKGIYIYRVFTETGSAISTGRLVIE